GSVRPLQRRRWPSYSVLHELSSAVLLPHDGRYRHGQIGGRRRNGYAWRQRFRGNRTDRACRYGKRSTLRNPRRWPHHWRWSCRGNRRVVFVKRELQKAAPSFTLRTFTGNGGSSIGRVAVSKT